MSAPVHSLTAPQAAMRMRISVPTLMGLAERHGLPLANVGGQWRISSSELDRWARDHHWHDPRPAVRVRDLVKNNLKAAA